MNTVIARLSVAGGACKKFLCTKVDLCCLNQSLVRKLRQEVRKARAEGPKIGSFVFFAIFC